VTVDGIAAAGDKLWKELVGTDVVTKVNHIGLGFTGLESSEIGQRSIEGFLKAGQTSKRRRAEDNDSDVVLDADLIEDHDQTDDDTPSFTCSRCGRTILSDLPLEEALNALRQEHDDFHFAQDLAKEQQPGNSLVISGPSRLVPSKTSPRKKPKRRDPPSRGGIEHFFGRVGS
jgi:DNA polymerase eta